MEHVFKITFRKVAFSKFREDELIIKTKDLSKDQFNQLKKSGKIEVINILQKKHSIYEIKYVRRGHRDKLIHIFVKKKNVESKMINAYHVIEGSTSIQSR